MVFIPVNKPFLGEEEIDAVAEVLRSGYVTDKSGAGPKVREFEEKFASFVGAKHAVAVNSGTAGLHASLLAIDLKHGDEVLLPSFTFLATAEAVVLAGGVPKFIDISLETYTIDPDEIRRNISEKTKAIIPVHLYGLPCEMDAIMEIAEDHGLYVIEDAAQAHGAEYKGKRIGGIGHLTVFSFYATKNMTTGEGGMITTNDDELAEKLRMIRTHGEIEPYKPIMLGHNYHMPEILAAIGIVQLKRLPEFIDKRSKNAAHMSSLLKEVDQLILPEVPKHMKHAWYLYTVRLQDNVAEKRGKLLKFLNENGIGAAAYYSTPVHETPFYSKYPRGKLDNTMKASKSVLSLPIHPLVTEKDVEYICSKVKAFFGE